jgi:hypothetical protein
MHIACLADSLLMLMLLGHVVVQLVEALRYKPEGSIPDGPSGRTVALGLTQPLTEMSKVKVTL